MSNEIFEIQRELLDIKKLLKEIHQGGEDDLYDYEEQADLGFFETKFSNEKLKTENIFEEVDVEEIQKIVTKALVGESMANKEPEQTAEITIELEQHIFMALAIEAHKRNMKFNDLVIHILTESLDKNLSEEEQTT